MCRTRGAAPLAAQAPNNLHCMAGLTTPPPQHTRTHTSTAVYACVRTTCAVRDHTSDPLQRPTRPPENKSIWAIDPNLFFFCSRCEGAREKNTKPPRMHARKRWLAEDHMIYLKSRLVRARERRATRHTTPHHTTRSRTQTHTPSLAAPFCKLRRGPEKREGAPNPVL